MLTVKLPSQISVVFFRQRAIIFAFFCHFSALFNLIGWQQISQDFSRFLKLSPIVETETETEMTKAQFMAVLSIHQQYWTEKYQTLPEPLFSPVSYMQVARMLSVVFGQ